VSAACQESPVSPFRLCQAVCAVSVSLAEFVEAVLVAVTEADAALECCTRRHRISGKTTGVEPGIGHVSVYTIVGLCVGVGLLVVLGFRLRKTAKTKMT
jgi:hypothetical protein